MSVHWLLIGPIDDDDEDGFIAEDRKEFLEDSGWRDVSIIRSDTKLSIRELAKKIGAKPISDAEFNVITGQPFEEDVT